MNLKYTRTALKQLKALARNDAKRIKSKIEQYAQNPGSQASNVTALQGSNLHRLRFGAYRVVFDKSGVILTILKIGHRRDVYR